MILSDLERNLKPVFIGILVIPVLFLVFSHFFIMIMGFVAFFFAQEGLAVGAVSLLALPIWLFCLPIKIPIQLSIGLVFLFLCSMYTLCFIMAWRFRESLQRVLRKAVSRPTRRLFNNCLIRNARYC